MNARTRFLSPGLAALTLGLALGLSPLAAVSDEAPSGGFNTTPQYQVFDLNFAGGPLSSYVDQLRALDPEVNILVQDNASDFPVPAMSLNNVSVEACIWTLNQLRVENDINTRALYSDDFIVVGGSPVIVLSSSISFRRTAAQRSSRGRTASVPGMMQTEVMSVGTLLINGFTPDMILNDIKQMRSLSGESDQSVGKAVIDTQTGLLMIHGTDGQIAQAWELLSALEDSSNYRFALQQANQPKDQAAGAESQERMALRLLTLEQLKQMPVGELQSRMVKLSEARKTARGNDELNSQLKEQFSLTLEALNSKRDE